jgi:hypothetical protein
VSTSVSVELKIGCERFPRLAVTLLWVDPSAGQVSQIHYGAPGVGGVVSGRVRARKLSPVIVITWAL